MTLYARVVDGAVSGSPVNLGDRKPADCFLAAEAALYRECDATVRHGWTWDGDKFAAPVESADEAKAAMRATASGHHERALSPFKWRGKEFQTDERSVAEILHYGALAGSAGDAWPEDFAWLAADNSAVPMTAAEMRDFALAVAERRAKSRLALRAAKDKIAAAADAAAARAVDVTAGYPA